MIITDTETIEVIRAKCNKCGVESGIWKQIMGDVEHISERINLMDALEQKGWIFAPENKCYCPECKTNES